MLAPYSEIARSNDGVGERHPLGAGVDQGEPEAELLLEAARGRQLGRGVVQSDGPGTTAGQPGRHVAGAAAKLDGVTARKIRRQETRLRFGYPPDAPARLGRRPAPQTSRGITACPLVPHGTVAQHMRWRRGLWHQGPLVSSCQWHSG